jgi:hypothetical protein
VTDKNLEGRFQSAVKRLAPEEASDVSDPTTKAMLRALRRARTSAARSARLHKAPLVYLEGGKIVRDRS